MTKPPGSPGVLEDVAAQLAGTAGECPAPLPTPAAVAVFAGDHGVHAQGVTPWPQEVTAQMAADLATGGAVVNAFAAGRGTGVDDPTPARKVDVVGRAVARVPAVPATPAEALAAVLLALPLVASAARALRDVATSDSAGVTEK